MRVYDMALVEEEWSVAFEPMGPTSFEAIPFKEWQFSHWEIAMSEPLSGDTTEMLMALSLSGVPEEVVTAHFSQVEFHLYVPNAFTPDNDGVNDAFLPLGSGFNAEKYTFTVFNRWGEVVFATSDSEEPWIGQNNQRAGTHFVPDGVYGYSVTAQGYHDIEPTVIRGTVTVVR